VIEATVENVCPPINEAWAFYQALVRIGHRGFMHEVRELVPLSVAPDPRCQNTVT